MRPSIFIFAVLIFLSFCIEGYTDTPQSIQRFILKGDYEAASNECDNIISHSPSDSLLDSVYYYRGLSNLKLGRYSSAQSDFTYIIDNYNNSRFLTDAYIGMGDTYFLAADYENAMMYYKKSVTEFPDSEPLPLAYYKLAQAALALKNDSEYQLYRTVLKEKYPSSLESGLIEKNAEAIGASEEDIGPQESERYFLQLGSFKKSANAKRLASKLQRRDYNAEISTTEKDGKTFYRVRIGGFASEDEAHSVKKRLAKMGYSARIVSE